MELFFYSHDSELQSKMYCRNHTDEYCKFYVRSTDTPICIKCK